MKALTIMSMTMSILAGAAAAADDVAGLAAARAIAPGDVELTEVRGAGNCPVVLSVDRRITGAEATRGAARLPQGWVLAGDEGALLQVLDRCLRLDSDPSQMAAIVSAMARSVPLTPVLVNADAMIRDRLADAGRGYLPPETSVRNGVLRLEYQALVGERAQPAAVTLTWTPGKDAAVTVTPY